MSDNVPTIAAVATAPGRGGVGVIRISGKNLLPMAEALCGKTPKPRVATYADFTDADGQAIDSGLLLFLPHRQVLRAKMLSSFRDTAGR